MYIGRFVDSYATTTPLDKTKACIASCPWWNPFCGHGCILGEAGYQAQVKGGPAITGGINQGLQNIGQQLGAGIGANAGTITPALTVLGIAAVGIIAIIMVIR